MVITNIKATDNIYKSLKSSTKPLHIFLKSQENLSHTRFIQGTATNWLPKAVFARSVADLGDISFLEFFESGLFYYAPSWIGEGVVKKGIIKKAFNKKDYAKLKNHLTDSIEEISNNKELKKHDLDKKIISSKASLVTGFMIVPILEYALGFAKNLFTLKVFKKSNFDNIANLDKNSINEDKAQQEKVETHAKKQLKLAGIYSAAALGASAIIAKHGHRSDTAQKAFKYLLEPAELVTKIFPKIKGGKIDKFLHEYTKLDFNNNNGKLGLSKGQLALTTLSGLFGYSSAAKDRGHLDFLEVWTRVPLVVFYTIFGSALFDSAFKKYLIKNGKYKELLKEGQEVPTLKELPKLAEQISQKTGKNKTEILDKLIRQKSIITGVPYGFALLVMGFTLAGISRLWTQYRYNHREKIVENNSFNNKFPQEISFQAYLEKIKSS